MDANEKIEQLEKMRVALEEFGALVNVTAMNSTDDVVRIWDIADRIRVTASILAREASTHAARDVGFNVQYEAPEVGTVHTTSQSTTKADGNALLHSLATKMIDPDTGENMDAIPVKVLLDVLPAVGPGQTSSKWKKKGLENLDIDTGKYIKTEYKAQQLARGPKQKR